MVMVPTMENREVIVLSVVSLVMAVVLVNGDVLELLGVLAAVAATMLELIVVRVNLEVHLLNLLIVV
jgi:hypothetical protein